MLCKLTCIDFKYPSRFKTGVHPEAFCFSLHKIKKILLDLTKQQSLLKPEDELYLRVATLLFLEEVANLKYGSVVYRPNDLLDDVFSPNELLGDIRLTLHLFDQPLPDLKKLKLVNIPCKRTVEFLQGVFYDFQEGKNYTPFKKYLQTTLLCDTAIEAIVEYDIYPSQDNLENLQLAISGQESLIHASDNEADYYNNKRMLRIKSKVDEFVIIDTKELNYVPTKNYSSEIGIPCPELDIEIS